jgi:uncharacterized protein with HEPN domain
MSEINEQSFLKDILEAVRRIQSYMDGVMIEKDEDRC